MRDDEGSSFSITQFWRTERWHGRPHQKKSVFLIPTLTDFGGCRWLTLGKITTKCRGHQVLLVLTDFGVCRWFSLGSKQEPHGMAEVKDNLFQMLLLLTESGECSLLILEIAVALSSSHGWIYSSNSWPSSYRNGHGPNSQDGRIDVQLILLLLPSFYPRW